MIFLYRALKIKSITVLVLGTVMLFSCKTNMKDVDAIGNRNGMPEMSGENMELFYSDSALLKYKVITPLYNKYNQDDKKYDEFPKGIHAELYEKDGSMVGSITSKYAKKLETDLMYWDMKKEIVYSDRYSRLTSGDQIIEGNKGFKSDQSLKNPVFNKITGVVEIENKP